MQALAIFTDGLQNLCLEAGSYAPYHPFFVPLFTQICAALDPTEAEAALVDFLQSERVTKRSDDDKTLVLLGRVDDTHSTMSPYT